MKFLEVRDVAEGCRSRPGPQDNQDPGFLNPDRYLDTGIFEGFLFTIAIPEKKNLAVLSRGMHSGLVVFCFITYGCNAVVIIFIASVLIANNKKYK